MDVLVPTPTTPSPESDHSHDDVSPPLPPESDATVEGGPAAVADSPDSTSARWDARASSGLAAPPQADGARARCKVVPVLTADARPAELAAAHFGVGDGDMDVAMNGHARNGHADGKVAAVLAADHPSETDEADEADETEEAEWLAMPAAGAPARPLVSSRPRQRRESARRVRHYILYQRQFERARHRRATRHQLRAFWVTLGTIAVLIAIGGVGILQVAALYYQKEADAIAGLRQTVAGHDSLRIYGSQGTLLYESGNLGVQRSIPLSHIPIDVINATVAIEDREFWTNQGIDFAAIARAALADLRARHPEQGASTITQQLIKQQIVGSTETYQRKLQEVILALGITTSGTYTKRDILEMYLNSIAYSPLAYGIDSAAQYYFGYSDDPATGLTAAQHLDLAQASMLAGIPQNPNLNDPFQHFAQARARQRQVLDRMVGLGYITRAQAQAAWEEAGKAGFFHRGQSRNLAPHFVWYVMRQLEQMSGTLLPPDLPRSGLSVYTTLDLNMQNHVQQFMRDHLYGNDRDDYGGGLIRNDHVTNSAALLVDHHTGAIKVMLGSVNPADDAIEGSFNVAVDGFRGPGSSFKPIVYATAFAKGWFPAATVADVPTAFNVGEAQPYRPLDFNPTQFRGTVTLRHALQDSLNIPAVRVMRYAGVDNVRRMAERLGVTQWAPGARWGLSSALGSLDVSLYEMVQAYTVFANYGQFIPLHVIDHITDGLGNSVYQYSPPAVPKQVLDPRIAFLITSMLSDNRARADEFGGCSPLYLDPSKDDCYFHHFDSPNAWPAAAKTGTGQDFTDDTTFGYTRDYTMGVWAGNNDHTPMHHIDGVTGSAPIWYHSMLYVEQGHPKQQFPVPQGMQRAHYCSNGVCTTDWFMPGPLPRPNVGDVAR